MVTRHRRVFLNGGTIAPSEFAMVSYTARPLLGPMRGSFYLFLLLPGLRSTDPVAWRISYRTRTSLAPVSEHAEFNDPHAMGITGGAGVEAVTA